MSKNTAKRLLALGAAGALWAAVPVAAQYADRAPREDPREVAKRLEKDAKKFSKRFDKELDKSVLEDS